MIWVIKYLEAWLELCKIVNYRQLYIRDVLVTLNTKYLMLIWQSAIPVFCNVNLKSCQFRMLPLFNISSYTFTGDSEDLRAKYDGSHQIFNVHSIQHMRNEECVVGADFINIRLILSLRLRDLQWISNGSGNQEKTCFISCLDWIFDNPNPTIDTLLIG